MHYPKILSYAIAETSQPVPVDLAECLLEIQNKEIASRMMHDEGIVRSMEQFQSDWLSTFSYTVMCFRESGTCPTGLTSIQAGREWKDILLGSFIIKPIYPDCSSHICTAEFIVNTASLVPPRDVRLLLADTYLAHASKLGYKYAMFDMVFPNDAWYPIWKDLRFNIIGHLPLSAQLENRGEPVEAFMLGKDLSL